MRRACSTAAARPERCGLQRPRPCSQGAVWDGGFYAKNRASQDTKIAQGLPLLREWAAELLSAPVRMLDVGCGDGGNTSALFEGVLPPSSTAVGVDLSERMIEHATRVHGSERLCFERHDATALPFDRDFDLAVSFNALHWVPADAQPRLYQAIHRALRPGGRLFVLQEAEGAMQAMFDAIADIAARDRWAARFAGAPPPSIYRPSVARAEELLRAAGFAQTAVTSVPHTSRMAGLAGVESRLLGAWGEVEAVSRSLPDPEERGAFLREVAAHYVSCHPPTAAGEVLLESQLLICRAIA
eukprot:TRINITY_DN13182_c0_g1_i1.p1 TRINITY_DN13182_c0_g1~~TRINITY_DN13182_c0_g1_i1.p1  ORF type:complete len:299 (+),score=81.34 TRINITY_DN13182_c0_g1_i1:75-971(+)